MPPPSSRPRRVGPAAAPISVLALAVILGAVGCGPATEVRPGDIRTYTLPKGAEPTVLATAAPRGEPRPAAAVRYEVPEGWSDGAGGSGMRLATLFIGPPADKLEVTVIPASGSLESNVTRWQGQLQADAAAEEIQSRAAAALAEAESVDVAGMTATVVLLRDTPADGTGEPAGQAILGAMIPVDERQSLFVKFKGDAAVALRERENFKRFVASIRREE